MFVTPNIHFSKALHRGYLFLYTIQFLFVSCNKCIYLGNNLLNLSRVPVGILILIKLLHQKNTLLPIDVTEAGIEMRFKLSHL